MNKEKALLEMLPDNIRFLTRDEKGELWATEKAPQIIESEGRKVLEFAQPMTLENTHSLSAFNHHFKELKKFDVLDVYV